MGGVGEEMEGVGGVQMGMGVGVGVCPHAVEQRAERIMPARIGPALLLNMQLTTMVLLSFARDESTLT